MRLLSIRRLSPAAASALGLRIYTTLPAALGHDGSVMAAMLLARCRQALTEPEGWPSLLDDAELKEAAAVYAQNAQGFKGAATLLGVAASAPALANARIRKNANLPEWLRSLGRGLKSLEVKLQQQFPPKIRTIKIPDAGFNRGRPFKTGGLRILQAYIGWILGTGALQNQTRANEYTAEMLKRGLVTP